MGVAKKKHKPVHFRVTREIETRPARIVSEPGRAYMRPGDGKLVPVVALDTSDRPDIEALFGAYTPATVGDVVIQWGQRNGAPKGTVTLFIQFATPVTLLLILDFEIVRQGVLVDQILRTAELYLEGVNTKRAAATGWSRVRVVVSDTKFGPIWEELLVEALAAQRIALGASERQGRLMAIDAIRRWRLGPH